MKKEINEKKKKGTSHYNNEDHEDGIINPKRTLFNKNPSAAMGESNKENLC